MMKNKFDRYDCDLINASSCEESLNEDGISMDKAEEEKFGE